MKSVRIRSFFGPYFPAFGLSTERYGGVFRTLPNIFNVAYCENSQQFSLTTQLTITCSKLAIETQEKCVK